jgi:hypothetical protein
VNDACTNLSTDMAIAVAKKFLKSMGQPLVLSAGGDGAEASGGGMVGVGGDGVSLLDEAGVVAFLSMPH